MFPPLLSGVFFYLMLFRNTRPFAFLLFIVHGFQNVIPPSHEGYLIPPPPAQSDGALALVGALKTPRTLCPPFQPYVSPFQPALAIILFKGPLYVKLFIVC